jgi:hypothetical protein
MYLHFVCELEMLRRIAGGGNKLIFTGKCKSKSIA